jgi:hypothetical protein
MIFSKLVPIISIWELKVGMREKVHPASALAQTNAQPNEAGAD